MSHYHWTHRLSDAQRADYLKELEDFVDSLCNWERGDKEAYLTLAKMLFFGYGTPTGIIKEKLRNCFQAAQQEISG